MQNYVSNTGGSVNRKMREKVGISGSPKSKNASILRFKARRNQTIANSEVRVPKKVEKTMKHSASLYFSVGSK